MMDTWTERWMNGRAQKEGRTSLLWVTVAVVALAVGLTGPPALHAQPVDIEGPGLTVKSDESGATEVEMPGLSVKVTPPEVHQTPDGETIDLSGVWRFKGDWLESGLSEGWYKPEFDDSEWRELHVPGSWESQGINTNNPRWPVKTDECGYNGFAWYRKQFSVPENWLEARVLLRIGGIYDEDWTYINGQSIGQMTGADVWDQQREYLIPPDVLRPDEDNVIAIRVYDSQREGGIVEGPVELVNVSAEGAAAVPPPDAREYTRTRGDVVRFGSSVTIDADEKVLGDVVAIGGSVEVSGYVTGDVVAVGGSVRIRDGARVDGAHVTAVGGGIHQDPGATVGGELVEVGPGITLPGGWFGEERAEPWGHGPRRVVPAIGLLGAFLVWGFLALLSVLLFRDRLETMAAALPVHPGRAVLYGLAGFVLTPAALVATVLVGAFVTAVLVITLVGILLVPAVWAAVGALSIGWVLLLAAGVVAVWLGVGKAVAAALKRPDIHPVWAALAGLVLVALAGQLPVIGGLVIATLIIFGFGLAIMTGFGTDPEWAQRRLGFRTSPPSPQGPTTPAAPLSGQVERTAEEALPEEEAALPEAEPEKPASAHSTEAEAEADEPEDASRPGTETSEEGEERQPEA
jgi:hypothetical protein